MLEKKVTNCIDRKAQELNIQGDVADTVSKKIQLLTQYINQETELTSKEIDETLSTLIGFFSTTLHIPLTAGTKFLRAVKNDNNSLENNVSKLSYIPIDISHLAKQGRLNRDGESIYYGCIYLNEIDGVNVAFSETSAEETHSVNILRSKSVEDLNVYFVGIYDYIHRGIKPRFISQELFSYFEDVYNYQEQHFSESAFLAHILCDAFLSDILRRKESGNLYEVTSLLPKTYLEGDHIDGLLYTSVKSEGNPVIAIKSNSVDLKLTHCSCDNYKTTISQTPTASSNINQSVRVFITMGACVRLFLPIESYIDNALILVDVLENNNP